MGAHEVILDVGGHRLSGLRAEPAQTPAMATVVALPGGGYNSAYWHHPACATASLLTLGAGLGYRVVALDRPGYGLSAREGCAGLRLDAQAAIFADLVNRLGGEPGAGEGVFLIGHSMGGILALMTAALQRTPRLLGLDLSGVPYRFSDDLAAAVRTHLDAPAIAEPGRAAASMFYGPPGTFDRMLVGKADISTEPVPVAELDDSYAWPSRFAEVVGRIDRPVQYTLGEYERTTRVDPESLQEIAGLFERSPRVETRRQAGAGHNISLHHVGRAYHLSAYAFFDEVCAALAQGQDGQRHA